MLERLPVIGYLILTARALPAIVVTDYLFRHFGAGLHQQTVGSRLFFPFKC